jgi:hypothetical protein
MILRPARLALLGTLTLALACGDDGDDDTAAGTTADPTAGSTTAASTTEAGTTAASGDETADPAVVCEALACDEGQICVATGTCPEEPFCVPAEMVTCDFGSGVCTVVDVCSGTLMDGAFDCEQCL